MCKDKEEILAEFYNFCGGILLGKSDEEKSKRIIQSMIDSGQEKIMIKEFTNIGNTLTTSN